MVELSKAEERLRVRLQSLNSQENIEIHKATRMIRKRFDLMSAYSKDFHFTRLAAEVLYELFENHEIIRERMDREFEERASLDRKIITTYTGTKIEGNSKGSSHFYVLSPATVKSGQLSCKLSRELSSHLKTVVRASHVALGKEKPDERFYCCFPHPFFFYQCNDTHQYIRKLNDRFNNLVILAQPRNFILYRLEHQVSRLPQEILNRLKHRNWENIFGLEEQLVSWKSQSRESIPYDEVALALDMDISSVRRLVTRRIFRKDGDENVSLESVSRFCDLDRYKKLADKYKVRSKLELNGRDAFERKKAALERLDGKGETLTFNEIADVLGISYMGAKELSRVESKEGRWKNLNFRRGRGNLARIPKSYVSDYIDTHEPTNRGWSYRGAEKRDGAPTQKDL